MSRITLSERTIEHLTFDGQEWTLETSAWQRLDRDIFAKAPAQVRGHEAITSALREVGADPSLSHQITKLLDRPPAVPTAYSLQDGQLHAETLTETKNQGDAHRPPATESYGMRLHDLRTELETLRQRVRYLEQFLEGADPGANITSNENGLNDDSSTLDAI